MADHNSIRNLSTSLLQKLSSIVNEHATSATFACGGSVPISDLTTGNLGHGEENTFPSVTLRFDSDGYEDHKISFPLPEHDNVSRRMFDSLLGQCQRATFGIGGLRYY